MSCKQYVKFNYSNIKAKLYRNSTIENNDMIHSYFKNFNNKKYLDYVNS